MPKPSTAPLTSDPTTKHTHTLILLHGRGSNAEHFANDTSTPGKPGLLHTRTSSGLTIQEALPSLKLIFPTAPARRCTARNRTRMNIWFDSASFENGKIREELHVQGLCENARELCEMVRSEAAVVGWERVFLGGMSEGYAMAVYVLAGLEDGLAGFVGLSGWMPFGERIERILAEEVDDEDCGVEFEREESIEGLEREDEKAFQALAFMREEILDGECRLQDLVALRKTPVFLGHGVRDDVVPLELGQELASTFQGLGCKVLWKMYPDLGHWFDSPAEMDDVVAFLKSNM